MTRMAGHALKCLLLTAELAARTRWFHGLVKFMQVFVVVGIQPRVFTVGSGVEGLLVGMGIFEGSFAELAVLGGMHEDWRAIDRSKIGHCMHFSLFISFIGRFLLEGSEIMARHWLLKVCDFLLLV